MEIRKFIQFSDLVRAIRKSHRLSQRAMAKALDVSPGYVGQWELQLSQPSTDMAAKLCKVFGIQDVQYVQRLAYAQRAPAWLRESILREPDDDAGPLLRPEERRIIDAVRRLSDADMNRLVERVEGWVDALTEAAKSPGGFIDRHPEDSRAEYSNGARPQPP